MVVIIARNRPRLVHIMNDPGGNLPPLVAPPWSPDCEPDPDPDLEPEPEPEPDPEDDFLRLLDPYPFPELDCHLP